MSPTPMNSTPVDSTPLLSITSDSALGALLGAGVGVGLLLMYLGLRGVDEHPRTAPRRRVLPAPDRRRLMVRALAACTVALAVGLLTGWVVGAALAGLASWALPRVLRGDSDHTRRVTRIEAIATWTEMVRDTLSAAAGLEQAILATAPLAPAAIRGEIAVLAAGLERGERLAPALRRLAHDLADPTADLVVAALVLAAERQARQLTELLGSLAGTAREQASMRLRIEASRARSRTSVRVIVATTITFAVAVVLLNRAYLATYDSLAGQVVLLGVGLLFAGGLAWLARIATVSEPTRFLLAADGTIDDVRVPEQRGEARS